MQPILEGETTMEIRDFDPGDIQPIIDILKANQQYGHPDMHGPEAMMRVHRCEAAEFLVAVQDGQVVGLIRGTYDGSRAIIYLASVHPGYQRLGIGRELVLAITRRFKERGAASIAVIIPGEPSFWQKMGFRQTTRLMQAYPIDNVLNS
jgi:predicted N-acetyltransferase YhbS